MDIEDVTSAVRFAIGDTIYIPYLDVEELVIDQDVVRRICIDADDDDENGVVVSYVGESDSVYDELDVYHTRSSAIAAGEAKVLERVRSLLKSIGREYLLKEK